MTVVPGGVVDQNLDAADRRGRLSDGHGYGRHVSQVGPEEMDRVGRHPGKPPDQRFARLFGDIDERYLCALHGKGFHERSPYAGTAAGDQHARILEVRKLGCRHRHDLIRQGLDCSIIWN